MAERRKGRQLPTQAVVLPYGETKGNEAIDLYNRSGRTAQEWQTQMVYDIMATDEDGLWVHMKYGWAVPRRNGKSEILIMCALWWYTHGYKVLYTAHRTTTSHNAWEKVIERLEKLGFHEKIDFKSTKQFGLERIEMLEGDGLINFRTRSSKGGLGEGYDLLIIDEAQEYTTDQQTALQYVVTDSQNSQTLMCGTPPTAVSAGTVFTKYRQDTLTGINSDMRGWAEWSIPKQSDPNDVDLWYETNPSLGTILTERTIRAEDKSDEIDYNIQRLGLWLTYNQKSAISKEEWDILKVDKPQLKSPPAIFIGVKYSKATAQVSLAVAVRTADNKIFVEAIDCRSTKDGNSWMMPYMRNPHVQEVVVDGANGQTLLAADMDKAGLKKPILPKVNDVIEANTLFEQNIFAELLCHSGQPALEQIVTNCEHRPIGSSGGFGYTSLIEGAKHRSSTQRLWHTGSVPPQSRRRGSKEYAINGPAVKKNYLTTGESRIKNVNRIQTDQHTGRLRRSDQGSPRSPHHVCHS